MESGDPWITLLVTLVFILIIVVIVRKRLEKNPEYKERKARDLEQKSDTQSDNVKQLIRDYKRDINNPDFISKLSPEKIKEEIEQKLYDEGDKTGAYIHSKFSKLALDGFITRTKILQLEIRGLINKYAQAKELFTNEIDKKRVDDKIEFFQNVMAGVVEDIEKFQNEIATN